VAVRVLVDSDLKTDPYHSTVINFPAKKFLLEAGIECRSDLSNRLLHSKYLILDRDIVVLGSHNWSAGSYFGFDDLTLAISSTTLAADLLARFESSWSHGH
jgi:phosphatidylserine/phosphatidylglycerophosphate/cardiolipin synthase-like enzyme